ncbi:hypothetical protein D3C76_1208420 [compost metagenome]
MADFAVARLSSAGGEKLNQQAWLAFPTRQLKFSDRRYTMLSCSTLGINDSFASARQRLSEGLERRNHIVGQGDLGKGPALIARPDRIRPNHREQPF